MNKLLIEATELKACSDVIILDVRSDLKDHDWGLKEYNLGHIPGALYVDFEAHLTGEISSKTGRHPLPNREEFVAYLASLGIDPSRYVVIYDAKNSMFASRLWWMLKWVGCTKVSILNGGFSAWEKAGYPLETRAPSPYPVSVWALSESSCRTVDDQFVKAHLHQDYLLLDARALSRFHGEGETLDPVAGHIPGAKNAQFMDNLDEDGYFLPLERLRARFHHLVGDTPEEKIILSCGSGVSACHNYFVMSLLGMDNVALYPGSWSQWCKLYPELTETV